MGLPQQSTSDNDFLSNIPMDVIKPRPCKREIGIFGERGIPVVPVFEVLSVTIYNNQTDFSLLNDINIYGQISITDYYDENIFNRDLADPDALSPSHNVLTLSGSLIRPFMKAKLYFTLKDYDTGAQLFNHKCTVDYSLKADIDAEPEYLIVHIDPF